MFHVFTDIAPVVVTLESLLAIQNFGRITYVPVTLGTPTVG